MSGAPEDLPLQVQQLVESLRERLAADEIARALGEDESFRASVHQLAAEIEGGATRTYGSLEERLRRLDT